MKPQQQQHAQHNTTQFAAQVNALTMHTTWEDKDGLDLVELLRPQVAVGVDVDVAPLRVGARHVVGTIPVLAADTVALMRLPLAVAIAESREPILTRLFLLRKWAKRAITLMVIPDHPNWHRGFEPVPIVGLPYPLWDCELSAVWPALSMRVGDEQDPVQVCSILDVAQALTDEYRRTSVASNASGLDNVRYAAWFWLCHFCRGMQKPTKPCAPPDIVACLRVFGTSITQLDAARMGHEVDHQLGLFAKTILWGHWDAAQYIHAHLPVLVVQTAGGSTRDATFAVARPSAFNTHCTAIHAGMKTTLPEMLWRYARRNAPGGPPNATVGLFKDIECAFRGADGSLSRNFLAEADAHPEHVPLFVKGVIFALMAGDLYDWVTYLLDAGVRTEWPTDCFRAASDHHIRFCDEQSSKQVLTVHTARYESFSIQMDLTNARTCFQGAHEFLSTPLGAVILRGLGGTPTPSPTRAAQICRRLDAWEVSSIRPLRVGFASLITQWARAGQGVCGATSDVTASPDEPPTRKQRTDTDACIGAGAPPTPPPPSALLVAMAADGIRMSMMPDVAKVDRFGAPATHAVSSEFAQMVTWFL